MRKRRSSRAAGSRDSHSPRSGARRGASRSGAPPQPLPLVAFEEGTLRPATAQTRIDAIEERIAVIGREEAELSVEAAPQDWDDLDLDLDLDLASALLGVSLAAIVTHELAPERSKALLRQLIEEIRVVSAAHVRVTYRVSPEVRLPDGMVEMRGLEPLTPAMRTQCSPS